ncbi:hypothetical protein EIP86_005634 [Pleurotus ostreatoroseus]|nr:hypothetical protein EIP86_005634 [Pleurotus ostreatoroseus]
MKAKITTQSSRLQDQQQKMKALTDEVDRLQAEMKQRFLDLKRESDAIQDLQLQQRNLRSQALTGVREASAKKLTSQTRRSAH